VTTFSTLAEVWGYITSSLESQSRARVINVCMALSMTKKGDMTISKYVAKMKALADEMASTGKRLDDEDLVSYILVGLDPNFDLIISDVSARVEPISVADLYRQLLSHEQRWELRQMTRGGRGGFGHRRGYGRGRGRNDFGRGSGGQENQFNMNPRKDQQC
jgi:hypothetical protein